MPPGYVLRRYDEVASTNAIAMDLLRHGAVSGTVVSAASQTGGRGRDGRTWQSPPGNLYASLAIRPPGRPMDVAQLSFASGVAVADTVAAYVGDPAAVTLKWPNDVLLSGRKLAGILLESDGVRPDGVDGLVIGIGINVAAAPATATRLPAATLAAGLPHGGALPSLDSVLAVLVARFDGLYRLWCGSGFAPVREAWLRRAHGLGETIVARLPQGTIEGRFVDLDPGGALVLETSAGRRLVHAGDVFFGPEAC